MQTSQRRETFFEQEQQRLAAEIAKGLEELISVTNAANREMEDESRISRDYINLAALWESFRTPGATTVDEADDKEPAAALSGLAGTGGHVVGPERQR